MIVTTLDWLMLLVLAASVALAARRALVFEALSVFTWGLIFFLAMLNAPDLAHLLFPAHGAQQEVYAVSFGLIIITLVLIGALYVFTLTSGAKARPAGRGPSGLLGLVRGIILLLAATVVITMTSLKHKNWWSNSRGAQALTGALQGVKPLLPGRFASKMD